MIQTIKKFKWWIASAVFVLLAILMLLVSSPINVPGEETEPLPKEEVVEIAYDVYGVDFENYIIYDEVVGRRQTLGHIFSQHGLSGQMIDNVVREMRDVFDPRRIRVGNSYRAYLNNDSLETLRYFFYDISPLEYVKIDFTDSVYVSRGEKEVSALQQEASGIIHSSLWETLTSNDLSPELAIKMSEILAWEVDFYRIQKGDRFKVVYDEEFVDDESVGIGEVHAIYFSHHGREITGFHFEKDTVNGFFDPDGENLRKVFLAAPLKFGRITSGYSTSRLHPVLGTRRPHYGTDYAAPTGTPIYAVGDGVITERSYTSGNGNYIRIRHNSVYETQYLHMSRFAKGIRPGVRVEQGDVIGYVGQTGLATGPHVCFRFWKNGQQVDHRKEEFPSADPLHEDYHQEFFVIRDKWLEVLNAIGFEDDEQLELPV